MLEVVGLTAEQIGEAAAEHGLALYELTPEKVSLEEAFMDLTHEETEYRANAKTNDNLAGTDRPERIAA
jgi:ABC-2 type transport system ATP-binding protein